jgi:hypothetical protein
MAEYKVIQDIEAEDKLVGPLSLRQFIYAGGAAIMGYLSFISIAKGVPFLLIAFLPPMLFCMFFAWPWSPDQPTEVWALARIRFYFKPRRRIWDQSGMKDLVTITVPKRIEKIYTDGLTQNEVRSRLNALAETIDSRGWAVKNANVSMPTMPGFDQSASDRLVEASAVPQPVADFDVQAQDDILDESNNPIAQQFEQMIQASTKAHRQEIVDRLNAPEPAPVNPSQPAQQPADYWFLQQQNQPNPSAAGPNDVVFAAPQVVQPGTDQAVGPVAATPTASEEALAQQLKTEHDTHQHSQTTHLKTINPMGDNTAQQSAAPQANPAAQAATTPQADAAILGLASNNDLNVDVLARQAKKARQGPESPDDEVVIPLR